MSAVVLRTGSREEALLARYERLRGRFALPRIDIRASAEEIHVAFEPFPPPLSREIVLVARALGWLAALEREWGEPLACALHPDEIRFDPERNLFVVGPGLLMPSGSPQELSRLASVLSVEVPSLSSFGELAAIASSVRPDLAELLSVQGSPEETIRHLSALCARSTGGDALRYADLAFQVRPTDPALAEQLTRAWIDASRPGEPPLVRDVLEAASSSRAPSGLLLARLAQRRQDLGEARRQIERSLQIQPESRAALSVLARVAHAQGDLERTFEALAALARLGDEAALARLVEQRRHAEVEAALERWPGAWTRDVVRFRIAQLHRSESPRRLILTFLEHIEIADPETFPVVREAAERLGTSTELREAISRAIERGARESALVRFFADLCRRAGVHGPILRLAGVLPGVLSDLCVAEALWEERQFERLLVFAPGDLEIAPLRLKTMVQLELESPGRFHPLEWESAARACKLAGGGARLLSEQISAISRVAPRFGPLPLLLRSSEV